MQNGVKGISRGYPCWRARKTGRTPTTRRGTEEKQNHVDVATSSLRWIFAIFGVVELPDPFFSQILAGRLKILVHARMKGIGEKPHSFAKKKPQRMGHPSSLVT